MRFQKLNLTFLWLSFWEKNSRLQDYIEIVKIKETVSGCWLNKLVRKWKTVHIACPFVILWWVKNFSMGNFFHPIRSSIECARERWVLTGNLDGSIPYKVNEQEWTVLSWNNCFSSAFSWIHPNGSNVVILARNFKFHFPCRNETLVQFFS